MAAVDLSHIDTSNYTSWEQVTGPSGQTYYVVPGNKGYVYDPFLSSAKGGRVFWINPSAKVKQQEEAKKSAQELQDAQIDASKPLNQLVPVAGSIGGLYAANKLSSMFSPAAEATNAAASSLGNAAAQGATSGTQVMASVPGAPAAPELLSATQVGGAPVEGVLPATGIAPYLGLAGAGLGAYGVYNAAKEGNIGSGALSGAGMGLGLGAAAPLAGFAALSPWGLAGMAALGALGGGGIAGIAGMGDKNMFQTEQKRLRELKDAGYNVDPILELQKGRSKQELIAAAEASGDPDTIKFANSRNENDLTAAQIQGYANIYERAGKEGTAADRMRISQEVIDAQKAGANVLREHHGTIDVNWDAFDAWKKSQAPVTVNPTTPQAAAK